MEQEPVNLNAWQQILKTLHMLHIMIMERSPNVTHVYTRTWEPRDKMMVHMRLLCFASLVYYKSLPLGWFASSAWVVCSFRVGWFAASAWGGCVMGIASMSSSIFALPCPIKLPRSTTDTSEQSMMEKLSDSACSNFLCND